MGISDLIACFINQSIADANGCAELQRAEIAQRFGCVPSQINYVISTRFSPAHGYLVESRRGGGGYIRITRVEMDCRERLCGIVSSIGDCIDAVTARAFLSNLQEGGVLTGTMVGFITAAISDSALRPVPPPHRDNVRAAILQQMLAYAICCKE